MSRKISFNHKLINKNTSQIIRTDTTENPTYIFNNNYGIQGGSVYHTETCDNSISVGQGNIFNSQEYGYPNGIYVHITDIIKIQEIIITHSTNSTNNNGTVKVTMKTPSNGYWYILEKKNEDNSYSVFKIYTKQLKTHTFTGLMGNKVYRIIVRDIRYYDTTRTWNNNQKFIYTEPFQIHDNYDIQYTQTLTQPLVNQINTAKYTIRPTTGYKPYTVTLKRTDISGVEISKTISDVGGLCEFKNLTDSSTYKVTIKDSRVYKNEQTVNSNMRIYSSSQNDSKINSIRPTKLSNDDANIIISGSIYGEAPYTYEIYYHGDTTPISGYTYTTINKDEVVTFYNLNGGETYHIKLKDGRGSSFDALKILYIRSVPVTIYGYEIYKPTDENNNDGIIKIYITGGLENENGYDYIFKNLTTQDVISGQTYGTFYEFDNLLVASYQVTVKDIYNEEYSAIYTINPYDVVYIDESNIQYEKYDPLNSSSNDGYIRVKVVNLPGGILDKYFRYDLRDLNNPSVSLSVIEHNITDVNSDTTFAEFNNLITGKYVLLIKTLKTEYNSNNSPYFNIELQTRETKIEYEIINDIYFEDDLTSMIIDPITDAKYSDLLNGFVFNIKRNINLGDFEILPKDVSKNKTLTYDVNLNRTRLRQINTYISSNSDILIPTNNYGYNVGGLNLEYNEFGNQTPKFYSLGDSNSVYVSNSGNNLIINNNSVNNILIRRDYNISNLNVKISELKVTDSSGGIFGTFATLYFDLIIDITLNSGVMLFNALTKFEFYKIGVNFKYTKFLSSKTSYIKDLVLSDFESKKYTFNSSTKTIKLTLRKKIAESTLGFSSSSIVNDSIVIKREAITNRTFKISNDNFVNNIYILSTTDTTVSKNTTYDYLQSTNQIESTNNQIDVNIKLISHQTHFNYGNNSINVFNEIKNSSLTNNDGSIFIRILGGYPLYDVKLFLDESEIFNDTTALIKNIPNLIGNTTYDLVVKDTLNKYYNNGDYNLITVGKDIDFISVSVIATKPSVIDNNDGIITLTVSPEYGETFTYILKYNDIILKKVVNGTSNTFTNLDGGLTYTVIVYNGDNNSYVDDVSIESYSINELGFNVEIYPPTNENNNDGYLFIEMIYENPSENPSETYSFSIIEVETQNVIISESEYNFIYGFYETPKRLLGGYTYLINIEDHYSSKFIRYAYIERYISTDINAEINVKNPNIETNDNGEIEIVVTTNNIRPYTFECKKKNTEEPEIVEIVDDNTFTFTNLGDGIDSTNFSIIYTITIIDSNNTTKTYDVTMYSVRKIKYTIIQTLLLNLISESLYDKLLNNIYSVDYNNQTPILWKNKRNVTSGTYQIETKDDSTEITQVDTFIDYIDGDSEYIVSLNNLGIKYLNESDEQTIKYLSGRSTPITITTDKLVNVFDIIINENISYGINIKTLNVKYTNIEEVITLDSIILNPSNYTEVNVIYGQIIPVGGIIQNKGICWSKTPNPSILNEYIYTDLSIDNQIISNLLDNTTYYFKGFAINNSGIFYSGDKIINIPVIISPTLTYPKYQNDVVVTSEGLGYIGCYSISNGAPIIEQGVYYGTDINNLIYKSMDITLHNGQFNPTINFNDGINKNYYFRAYSTNSKGTTYRPPIGTNPIAFYYTGYIQKNLYITSDYKNNNGITITNVPPSSPEYILIDSNTNYHRPITLIFDFIAIINGENVNGSFTINQYDWNYTDGISYKYKIYYSESVYNYPLFGDYNNEHILPEHIKTIMLQEGQVDLNFDDISFTQNFNNYLVKEINITEVTYNIDGYIDSIIGNVLNIPDGTYNMNVMSYLKLISEGETNFGYEIITNAYNVVVNNGEYDFLQYGDRYELHDLSLFTGTIEVKYIINISYIVDGVESIYKSNDYILSLDL